LRKLTLVLALAACLAGLAALGSAGAAPKPKAAGAKLTINSFPEGVFGYLSGAKASCLEGRKVVVYEQIGNQRDPGTDHQVGSDRTSLDEGRYRYSVPADDNGRYYAQAPATNGCAAAQTGSVRAQGLGGSTAPSGTPVCSPFTPETPSELCTLQRGGADWGISYDFPSAGIRACELSKSDYSCSGNGGGPFAFGETSGGGRGSVTMSWHPRSDGWKAINVVVNGGNGYGSSRMEARLPNPGSADLYVEKWTVPTDNGGTAEFFTPNLPGQKAGEPGGPLYLNFEGGKGAFGLGAEVHIKGFLYVKR
jgi:hypothetical protein